MAGPVHSNGNPTMLNPTRGEPGSGPSGGLIALFVGVVALVMAAGGGAVVWARSDSFIATFGPSTSAMTVAVAIGVAGAILLTWTLTLTTSTTPEVARAVRNEPTPTEAATSMQVFTTAPLVMSGYVDGQEFYLSRGTLYLLDPAVRFSDLTRARNLGALRAIAPDEAFAAAAERIRGLAS